MDVDPLYRRARQRKRHQGELPPLAILLVALVLVGLLILVGPLISPSHELRPMVLELPTATLSLSTAAPTLPPSPIPTPRPTPLPEGYQALATDVSNASFALSPDVAAAALRFTAGAMVRYTGERLGDRCRVEALPTPGAPQALVWMDCAAVGVR
jgi:hypothetical protein